MHREPGYPYVPASIPGGQLKQLTATAEADEAEGGKQASRHRSAGDSVSQTSVLHIPSAPCQVGSHGALSRGSCADRGQRQKLRE